ncbi:MAG TPA: Wzz/FepE/Etk N-terminal domain-containing protein, partial [Polyangiaceae bacterium]|nr:Wzz/FepE/Etk N-terminal domain-containing protein [Polyangiaceae bacterium]
MSTTIKPPPAANPSRAPLREASQALVDAGKVLRKRWAWVVTLAISTIALAAFYTAHQQRIYRASCVIQIDPRPPKPLGQDVQAIVDVGAGAYWANTEYYKTQFQIIQSRAVAEETVRRLSLDHDAAFLSSTSPGQQPPSGAPSSVSVEQAAQRVRGQLGVEPVRDSRLVTITYRDPNPERARQILSTLVSVYMDRNIDTALDSTNSAADWLRGQVDNLKEELEGTELALHEYKKDNRILSVSLDDQSNMLRQEMQQLSAALTSARVRRTQVAAQADEIASLDQGVSGAAGTDRLVNDSIRKQRETLQAAIAERESLIGSGKGENHPLVVSATARVAAARAALEREISNVKQGVQRDLTVVDHEIASL